MRTALYETSGGALAALLATRSFVWATLYTITPVSGSVMRYAAADLDIAYSGNTWVHSGPVFEAGDADSGPRAHWKTGFDVDTWQVTVVPRDVHPITGAAYPDQIEGQPWTHAVRGGVLDGATVTVDRAYFATWPTGPAAFNAPAAPVGVINIFAGRIAAVDFADSGVILSINSHLELLREAMPRDVFQAPCRATLFDERCTLTAASYAVTSAVAASSTQIVIRAAIASVPGSGTLAQGRLVMTSGENAGFQRGIRAYTPGTTAIITLIAPFYFPVAVGDTFTVYPGCDKRRDTCDLFGNGENFRGFRFIPVPELAL